MSGTLKPTVVAHVLYSFDEIGGLENGVVNLINNLPADRYKHIICALTRAGELKNRVKNNNVEYYSLNKRSGNDPFLPLSLWKIFRNHSADVVHLRNWPTMVEGFIAARMARVKKIIYSEHGRHFDDLEEGKIFNTLIKKHIFNRVECLLAVSRQLGDEMTQRYDVQKNIRVIPNGVDSKRFCPMPGPVMKARLGLDPDDFIVGTVSRLDKVKNLDLFLDAAFQTGFPARILIAGDGPERVKLGGIVERHGARDRVMLLGNRSDIPDVLNCLDVFVLPSKSEGMSNVVLEAMSCGIPVVAFDVGGNRELIDNEQGGYLIEPYDFGQFLNTLDELACSPEVRAGMGVYNRKKVVDSFSIEYMAKAYADLYDRITANINLQQDLEETGSCA